MSKEETDVDDTDQPEEVSPEQLELEESYKKVIGKFSITSPGSAAITLSQVSGGADTIEVRDFLNVIVGNVNEGNLNAAESLLVTQAYALNAIFHRNIRKCDRAELIDQGEYHADIAFRAQAQCNRTLRTLLEYKNPKRATFIKQQNNMQVNHVPEEKEKSKESANKILEVDHDAWLDTRTQEEAVRSDTPLEAVGEDDRPKNGRR